MNYIPKGTKRQDWETKIDAIEIGSGDTILIDKCYGPTIFADLKITADITRGWVIERMWIKSGEFVEWCVIPAQIEEEFTEE